MAIDSARHATTAEHILTDVSLALTRAPLDHSLGAHSRHDCFSRGGAATCAIAARTLHERPPRAQTPRCLLEVTLRRQRAPPQPEQETPQRGRCRACHIRDSRRTPILGRCRACPALPRAVRSRSEGRGTAGEHVAIEKGRGTARHSPTRSNQTASPLYHPCASAGQLAAAHHLEQLALLPLGSWSEVGMDWPVAHLARACRVAWAAADAGRRSHAGRGSHAGRRSHPGRGSLLTSRPPASVKWRSGHYHRQWPHTTTSRTTSRARLVPCPPALRLTCPALAQTPPAILQPYTPARPLPDPCQTPARPQPHPCPLAPPPVFALKVSTCIYAYLNASPRRGAWRNVT